MALSDFAKSALALGVHLFTRRAGLNDLDKAGRRVVIGGDSILAGAVQSQSMTSVSIANGEILVQLAGGIAMAPGHKVVLQFTNYEAINNTPLTVSRVTGSSPNTLASNQFAIATSLADNASISNISGRTLTLVTPHMMRPQSPISWLKSMIKGGFEIVGSIAQNGAVSGPYAGEPAANLDMLSVAQKALPLFAGNADYFMVCAGGNDYGGTTNGSGTPRTNGTTSAGQTVDFTYQNLYAMGLLALQYGMTPIILTPTPIGGFATIPPAAQLEKVPVSPWDLTVSPGWIQALRSRLLELGRKDTRFKILDMTGAAINPTSANGYYKDDYLTDTVHTCENGGYQMARLLLASAKQIFPDMEPPATVSIVDAYSGAALNVARNVLPNPLMQGNTGTISTSTAMAVTGVLPPTSWKCQNIAVTNVAGGGFITVSTPARADGYGNDFQCAYNIVDASPATQRWFMTQSSFQAKLTAGQWYKFGVEMTVVNCTNIRFANLNATVSHATIPTNGSEVLTSSNAGPFPNFTGRTETFYLESAPVFCPASATGAELRCEIQTNGVGSGTVRIGRAYVIPCNAPS